MLLNLIYLISFLFCFQIEPFEGLRNDKPRVWALVNSTVHTEPGKFILNGTIIIRDGIIQDVGIDILVPDDAVVIDMTNKHIYSGFIESYFNPKIEYSYSHQDDHWNHKLNAHRSMSKIY